MLCGCFGQSLLYKPRYEVFPLISCYTGYVRRIIFKCFFIVFAIFLLAAVVFAVYLLILGNPKPPEGKVEVYKGLWMPALGGMPFAHFQALNFKQLKDDGVNTIAFGPVHQIEGDGTIWENFISRWATIWQIKRAHKAGIRVLLVSEISGTSSGAPENVSKKHLENPLFWQNLKQAIINDAKLAQKHGVEMYSPLNEPEYKFREAGIEKSWEWAGEIVKEIREVYQGKIVWKAATICHDGELGDYPFESADFTGYNLIGFSNVYKANDEQYRTCSEKSFEAVKGMAERAGAEFGVSEFGAWELEREQQVKLMPKVFEITFEEGERHDSSMYLVFEAPMGFGASYQDLKLEVKKWFGNLGI